MYCFIYFITRQRNNKQVKKIKRVFSVTLVFLGARFFEYSPLVKRQFVMLRGLRKFIYYYYYYLISLFFWSKFLIVYVVHFWWMGYERSSSMRYCEQGKTNSDESTKAPDNAQSFRFCYALQMKWSIFRPKKEKEYLSCKLFKVAFKFYFFFFWL